MNEGGKRIMSDMLLYLPAKIIEGIIGILTISYMTRVFTQDAYGEFISINTSVNFAFIIFGSWIANSAARYAGEYINSESQRKTFYSAIAAVWLTISLFIFFAAAAAAKIADNQFIFLGSFMLFGYMSFQIASGVLVQLGKKLAHSFLSLYDAAGKLALIAVLAFCSLPADTPFWAVVFYGAVDTTAFIAAVLVLKAYKSISVKAVSGDMIKRSAAFGLPLIGVSFSIGLLNISDRYLVQWFAGPAGLAVYGANYSIASAVFTMISVGVMRAVYPSILKAYREKGANGVTDVFSSGVRAYLLAAVPACAGLAALGREIAAQFLDKQYLPGAPVISIVAAGMLFLGLTEYCNKAWELKQNTGQIFVNSSISAAVNICSNIILLPVLGYMAAAVNTLLAYVVYFLLAHFRSRRLIALRLSMRTWLTLVVAGLFCGGAAYLCTLAPLPGMLKILAATLAGGLAYAAALVVLGELNDELAYMKRLLLKK